MHVHRKYRKHIGVASCAALILGTSALGGQVSGATSADAAAGLAPVASGKAADNIGAFKTGAAAASAGDYDRLAWAITQATAGSTVELAGSSAARVLLADQQAGAQLTAVPTTADGVCLLLDTGNAPGTTAGCFDEFPEEGVSLTAGTSFSDEGQLTDVTISGIAADGVDRVDIVSADGSVSAAGMGENALFWSSTSPDSRPASARILLDDGSYRVVTMPVEWFVAPAE